MNGIELSGLIADSFQKITINFSGVLFSMVFLTLFLGRRRSLKVMVIYLVIKLLEQSVLYPLGLQMIDDRVAVQAIHSCMTMLGFILNFYIFNYTFKGGMVKVNLISVASELVVVVIFAGAIACTNIVFGVKNLFEVKIDSLIYAVTFVVFEILLCLIIVRIFGSLMKRVRSWKVKHPVILFALLIFYTVQGTLTRVTEVEDYNWIMMFQVAVIGLLFVVIALSVTYFYQNYWKKVRDEHEYLALEQNLMETHYTAIQMQIHKMEKNQKLIDEQMERIMRIDVGRDTIASYLRELEAQYQLIQSGIYCDEWTVDAVLCRQKKRCEEANIAADISMQGYRSGGMDEKDLTQVLLNLFDQGIQLIRSMEEENDRKLRIHVGTVANQTIIRADYNYTVDIRQKKQRRQQLDKLRKSLRRYIDKYHGTVRYMNDKNGVSIVIAVSNKSTYSNYAET
ncbi:MAG: hypothetical protein EOM40_02835 [Clostridia bacterium]|nr:hypothetical protein [Clostridia bacterium]NCC42533.1 hypothetical protein [Clostridia bacterium]